MTSDSRPSKTALVATIIALAIIPINVALLFTTLTADRDEVVVIGEVFSLLALAQLVAGIVAIVSRVRARRADRTLSIAPIVLGSLAAIGAPLGWAMGMLGLTAATMGGAWGRPLRVRGRQLHPELTEGADWTDGERPDGAALDEADRRALEALWLHDAQKEHASVPAFSRISWALAAVGAPAELLAWSHRAALEEIDHARRCFALAAGYGGRSFTVEPMTDLLIGALELGDAPLQTLARESVSDGCQLEDFNADVAAACAQACEEPATRRLLEQIAREERSHADFSWALLDWLVARHPAEAVPAIARAMEALDRYPRPTAVSAERAALVARADAAVLRRHGRLPDDVWGALWSARLEATRDRIGLLLAQARARATTGVTRAWSPARRRAAG
jgi:hypothetical protein